MSQKIAIFPGSFDPITTGHESIIQRALPLFDKIIVAIGVNSAKEYLFPAGKRKLWIEKIFPGEKKIEVNTYKGLTIDFCKQKKANYILRGLRTSADFEFERVIAQMNRAMNEKIETVFILSTPELSAINSTIVRDIIRNGGDAAQFVPSAIWKEVK
ncbi:MAG: pantetheine-phosphate adenylyltransferase [Bacteroidetes bacterium]|nr:MAG: pantetheine-phosphate adenylyltransferase [Bacteroidota bacterium]